jgi:hypothetical protein
MFCRFTGAAGLVLLFARAALAQVIPGDSPKNSLGDAVAHSTSRPILGISRATVPKGTSNARPTSETRNANSAKRKAIDPWASVRDTPVPDRHRDY